MSRRDHQLYTTFIASHSQHNTLPDTDAKPASGKAPRDKKKHTRLPEAIAVLPPPPPTPAAALPAWLVVGSHRRGLYSTRPHRGRRPVLAFNSRNLSRVLRVAPRLGRQGDISPSVLLASTEIVILILMLPYMIAHIVKTKRVTQEADCLLKYGLEARLSIMTDMTCRAIYNLTPQTSTDF